MKTLQMSVVRYWSLFLFRALRAYALILRVRMLPLAMIAALLSSPHTGLCGGNDTNQMQKQASNSCPPIGNSKLCNGLCEPGFSRPRFVPFGDRGGKHAWCQTDPINHKLSWSSDDASYGGDFLVCRYEFDKKLGGVNQVYLDFSGGVISAAGGGKLLLAVYDVGSPEAASRVVPGKQDLDRSQAIAAELKKSARYYREWTSGATIPGLRVAVKFTKPVNSCSVVLVGIDTSAGGSVNIRLNGLRVSTRPSASTKA